MILNDHQIVERNKDESITIKPFDEEQVQPASYDLRVGEAGYSTSRNGRIDIQTETFFELKPGDFGIVLTLETLELGLGYTARMGLRSSYARKGIVAITGPQVDPGFRGQLTIALTNLSPKSVTFPYMDDFITIEVHELGARAHKGYDSSKRKFSTFTPEEIKIITEGGNTGLVGTTEKLRLLSESDSQRALDITKISHDVDRLTQSLKDWQKVMTIGFVLVLGVMGALASASLLSLS